MEPVFGVRVAKKGNSINLQITKGHVIKKPVAEVKGTIEKNRFIVEDYEVVTDRILEFGRYNGKPPLKALGLELVYYLNQKKINNIAARNPKAWQFLETLMEQTTVYQEKYGTLKVRRLEVGEWGVKKTADFREFIVDELKDRRPFRWIKNSKSYKRVKDRMPFKWRRLR